MPEPIMIDQVNGQQQQQHQVKSHIVMLVDEHDDVSIAMYEWIILNKASGITIDQRFWY